MAVRYFLELLREFNVFTNEECLIRSAQEYKNITDISILFRSTNVDGGGIVPNMVLLRTF